MLINDEFIHSAWHLCYTAEGNYLYEDLDSSCGCSTGTLESVSESSFLYSFLKGAGGSHQNPPETNPIVASDRGERHLSATPGPMEKYCS